MMRSGREFIGLALLFPALAWGAFESRPSGARSAALGGLCAAGGADGWSGVRNPALLLQADGFLVGASVTPGLFGLPELAVVDAMAIVPAGKIRVGISITRFGNDRYRETEGGLSLATPVQGDAAIGACVRLYHLSITGYGSAVAAGIDVGLALRPAPPVSVSLALTNCAGASIGACGEAIPRSVITSFEWNLRPVAITVEISKEEGSPMSVAAGCECCLGGILHLRAGCTTEYTGVSAGGGIAWSLVRLDYAWRWHASLGSTHTISLTVGGLL